MLVSTRATFSCSSSFVMLICFSTSVEIVFRPLGLLLSLYRYVQTTLYISESTRGGSSYAYKRCHTSISAWLCLLH